MQRPPVLLSSYSLSLLDDSNDEYEHLSSSMQDDDIGRESSRMGKSSLSARNDARPKLTQPRGRYHEPTTDLDSLYHLSSEPRSDRSPLPVPLPPRRPFRFPVRQSSSGRHLTLRPLAKPRFHARFGERPVPGILLADELGLEVPSDLRSQAVLRSPPMDDDTMLPSWIKRQSKVNPDPDPSLGPMLDDDTATLWQEDPDLDLDELGEWVPQWACRMSRHQILDIEAMQAYEALRSSSSSSWTTHPRPSIRIFKSGGYILAHFEAMLVQTRLDGVLKVTQTIKDADCVVAKSTWSDGRRVNLDNHKKAARKRGVPFVLVESLKARELILKLRPLLMEKGLLDPHTALTASSAAATSDRNVELKSDRHPSSTSPHKLISLTSSIVLPIATQWKSTRSRARDQENSALRGGDPGAVDNEVLKLQEQVLKGEMTLAEFTRLVGSMK